MTIVAKDVRFVKGLLTVKGKSRKTLSNACRGGVPIIELRQ